MKILITGAAKRIGRMMTEHLVEQGHQIAIHYNSSENAAIELLESLKSPENHTTVQANLSKLSDAEQVLPELIKKWGKPDAIINNASTYFRRGMVDFTNEELLDDFTVNFFSPMILMRDFKKHCGNGKIINFVDRRVNITDPEAGPYALAKKSLRDATLSCAEDWSPEIMVNAIAPGPVLLPNENFNEADKGDSLKLILNKVSELLSSEITGSVTVIE